MVRPTFSVWFRSGSRSGGIPRMTAGQFVDPVSHEGRVHLIFAEYDLKPYYAINSVIRSGRSTEKWETEGKPTETIRHHGEKFRIAADYDEQEQLAPPVALDSWEMESTPLFRFYVASSDRLSDGEPADQSSRTVGGTVTIRPRWPDMRKPDGEPISGVPVLNGDKGYIDADIQLSNIPHDEYPELLREVFAAFDLSPKYLRDIHDSSNIQQIARYVRLKRRVSGPVYAPDGPLARTHGVMAASQTGYRKHVENHQKIDGYRVAATIDDERAADLIRGHKLGKEIKHYYPREPEYYDQSDALYHPKLEVGFKGSKTEGSTYWTDLDQITQELDETLFNYLEWSDLPIRPDGSTYEKDAVFKPTESHRSAKIVDCPLPDIEDSQKAAVMRVWGSTTESDRDLIDSLVSDGGRPTREELANRTEYSYRTVRRFVNRCEDVVRDTYDGLSLESKHQEQMLIDRVRTAESQFRESVENAVTTAANAVSDMSRSEWTQTKQDYGITINEKGPKNTIKVRYKPESRREVKTVIRDIKTAARRWFDSLRRYSLEITTIGGEYRHISNLETWKDRGSDIRDKGEFADLPQWAEPADKLAKERYGKSIREVRHQTRKQLKQEVQTPG